MSPTYFEESAHMEEAWYEAGKQALQALADQPLQEAN